MISHKFEPGEVTPEQLEQFQQKYDAALKEKQAAYDRYYDAYYVYCDALVELREAKDVYIWAKQGMVEATP